MRRPLRLLKGGGVEKKMLLYIDFKRDFPVKKILESNENVKKLYRIVY